MIYEVRTYDLKPRSVPVWEKAFGDKLDGRQKFSPLGGLWHTEFGPLNQVVHIWPYDDLSSRGEIRGKAASTGAWPPTTDEPVILNMQSDFYVPAPFMPEMKPQKLGPIYEMRIYTYAPGDIPKVVEAWGNAIEERTKFSPLVAAMYSDVGNLNKWLPERPGWPRRARHHRDPERRFAAQARDDRIREDQRGRSADR